MFVNTAKMHSWRQRKNVTKPELWKIAHTWQTEWPKTAKKWLSHHLVNYAQAKFLSHWFFQPLFTLWQCRSCRSPQSGSTAKLNLQPRWPRLSCVVVVRGCRCPNLFIVVFCREMRRLASFLFGQLRLLLIQRLVLRLLPTLFAAFEALNKAVHATHLVVVDYLPRAENCSKLWLRPPRPTEPRRSRDPKKNDLATGSSVAIAGQFALMLVMLRTRPPNGPCSLARKNTVRYGECIWQMKLHRVNHTFIFAGVHFWQCLP